MLEGKYFACFVFFSVRFIRCISGKKYDMHKNYLRSIFLRLHVGRYAFALCNMLLACRES